MSLDRAVMEWMAAHRTGAATTLARDLMQIGTRPVPLLAVGVLALAGVAALRAWRPAVAAAIAAMVAVVLTEVGKHVVHRPRPPAALALVRAGGFSMPSTDAAVTAAAATSLAVAALAGGRWAGRVFAAALGALTLVVGVALVYLGAHWPTDVLAGWLLGAAAGAGCAALLRPRPADRETPGAR